MKLICIISIILFFNFFVFAEIPTGYYDSCNGLVEDALRLELKNIISTNSNTSYTASKGMMYSEIDNDNGVITGVYSGFEVNHNFGNTSTPANIDCEHSYCQSWIDEELIGSENSIAKADIHHLFPAKSSVNIARSNNPLDFIDEISYTYTEDGGTTVSYLGTNAELEAVFEPAEEGGFTVYVPSLPGCISEGDTFEEAVENIKEAVELYLYPDEENIYIGVNYG